MLLTRRRLLALLPAGSLGAMLLTHSPDRVEAAEDEANAEAYKCKITNNTGQRVQVRILHFREDIGFKEAIENGETVSACSPRRSRAVRAGDRVGPLLAGERPVIAWSCDKTERIVAIGKVIIDQSVEIVLTNDGRVGRVAAYETDPTGIE
jgi:hypothetical protein